jgi:phospholipid/cholesterol/gamma-HCH transport system substrate-binding protein
MDERVMQFRVGVTILASLIIAAILVLIFVGDLPSLRHGSYEVYVVFPQAPGVTRDTPVRKNGIRIGRVTAVDFAPEDKGVIVTIKIDGNRKIYRNEVCRLTRSLVLGDVALEFAVPKTPPDSTQGPNGSPSEAPAKTGIPDARAGGPGNVTLVAAKDAEGPEIRGGETIQGQLDKDLLESVNKLEPKILDAIDSFTAAGKQMDAVLKELRPWIAENKGPISDMIRNADKTFKSAQSSLDLANEVLGDPKTREQFKAALQKLPGLLEDTQGLMGNLNATMAKLQGTVSNVDKLAKPLGEHGEELAENFNATVRQLSQLTQNLNRFSAELNNPESSLNQFARDRELYARISRTAKNVDDLTRQLKPVLEDARVFSDKIARHPETLGVRGALQRNPGIK